MPQVTIHERPGRLRRPVLLRRSRAGTTPPSRRRMRPASSGARGTATGSPAWTPRSSTTSASSGRSCAWSRGRSTARSSGPSSSSRSAPARAATSSWAWGSSRTSAGRPTAGRCSTSRRSSRWDSWSPSARCWRRVPHTRPVRLTGFATDPGAGGGPGRPSDSLRGSDGHRRRAFLDGPGVGACDGEPLGERAALHLGHGELAATLALVQRVNRLFDGPLDYRELEEAATQFDSQLTEVLQQNRKVASYVRRLETKDQGGRGARAVVPRGPAELEGPGGGDRALPAPAAARTAPAGVADREPLTSSRPPDGVLWWGCGATGRIPSDGAAPLPHVE